MQNINEKQKKHRNSRQKDLGRMERGHIPNNTFKYTSRDQ